MHEQKWSASLCGSFVCASYASDCQAHLQAQEFFQLMLLEVTI